MTNKRKVNLHFIGLETIDNERLIDLELYQQWMPTVFNKRPVSIIPKGDLHRVIQGPIITDRQRGKLEPNWDGLLITEKVLLDGAYLLRTMDGNQTFSSTSARFL